MTLHSVLHQLLHSGNNTSREVSPNNGIFTYTPWSRKLWLPILVILPLASAVRKNELCLRHKTCFLGFSNEYQLEHSEGVITKLSTHIGTEAWISRNTWLNVIRSCMWFAIVFYPKCTAIKSTRRSLKLALLCILNRLLRYAKEDSHCGF